MGKPAASFERKAGNRKYMFLLSSGREDGLGAVYVYTKVHYKYYIYISLWCSSSDGVNGCSENADAMTAEHVDVGAHVQAHPHRSCVYRGRGSTFLTGGTDGGTFGSLVGHA